MKGHKERMKKDRLEEIENIAEGGLITGPQLIVQINS